MVETQIGTAYYAERSREEADLAGALSAAKKEMSSRWGYYDRDQVLGLASKATGELRAFYNMIAERKDQQAQLGLTNKEIGYLGGNIGSKWEAKYGDKAFAESLAPYGSAATVAQDPEKYRTGIADLKKQLAAAESAGDSVKAEQLRQAIQAGESNLQQVDFFAGGQAPPTAQELGTQATEAYKQNVAPIGKEFLAGLPEAPKQLDFGQLKQDIYSQISRQGQYAGQQARRQGAELMGARGMAGSGLHQAQSAQISQDVGRNTANAMAGVGTQFAGLEQQQRGQDIGYQQGLNVLGGAITGQTMSALGGINQAQMNIAPALWGVGEAYRMQPYQYGLQADTNRMNEGIAENASASQNTFANVLNYAMSMGASPEVLSQISAGWGGMQNIWGQQLAGANQPSQSGGTGGKYGMMGAAAGVGIDAGLMALGVPPGFGSTALSLGGSALFGGTAGSFFDK